jgi:hypothetical protein
VPPIQITIEEGKYGANEDKAGAKVFRFLHADGTQEELIIPAHALAYIHTVKRTVQPEPKNPAEV